jgi:excisionase family DNA binding protein
MTISDFAEYLQVSKSSFYKLVPQGKLPSQKIGKHWRFHKDAADRWLTSNVHGVLTAAGALGPGVQGGGAA